MNCHTETDPQHTWHLVSDMGTTAETATHHRHRLSISDEKEAFALLVLTAAYFIRCIGAVTSTITFLSQADARPIITAELRGLTEGWCWNDARGKACSDSAFCSTAFKAQMDERVKQDDEVVTKRTLFSWKCPRREYQKVGSKTKVS